MLSAGINGLGRFGLHLLKYWLDYRSEARFSIDYINDDYLTSDQILLILKNDKYVQFPGIKFRVSNNTLIISENNKEIGKILLTNSPHESIPWIGFPKIFLECSGKNTDKFKSSKFLTDNTEVVLISATAPDVDKTLIFGFNHENFSPEQDKIVSYGSCTVNAYVPFAKFINERYGVADSDVNVIHNISEYKLAQFDTLLRKYCTLEDSGPSLLDFLSHNNFVVNYTVVPYTGVSIMDYRFKLNNDVSVAAVINDIQEATTIGQLKYLYKIQEIDNGPEEHLLTRYSSVIIKSRIRKLKNNLYITAYFDNENSVNRYFDLANHISNKFIETK